MPNITFSDEGPQFYGLAYARNKPYAKGGPYFTKLTPHEETQFRQWLKTSGNPSNFDPDAKVTDYDMRGYWKDYASKGKNLSGINKSDMRLHFPDTYKTPYDTTFSGESRYAKPNLPLKWVDSGVPGKERLINTKTGEVLFIKTAPGKVPGYPAGNLPDVTQPPALRPATGMGPPAPMNLRQPSIMNPVQRLEGGGPTSDIDPVLQQVSRTLAIPQELITGATKPGATALLGPKYGPLAANALGVALPLSFGDPEGMASNITKEQRDAWELENITSRPGSASAGSSAAQIYKPGTRVKYRLLKYRRGLDAGDLAGERNLAGDADWGSGEGTIVQPGTISAGKPQYNDPGSENWTKPPGPGWVAVRTEGAPGWHWRHRGALEILPPKEEFQIGDKVTYTPNEFESPNKFWAEGVIAEPPANAPPSPGPDYVWADISKGKPVGRVYDKDLSPGGGIVKYKGGTWGGWFHKSYFEKKGK